VPGRWNEGACTCGMSPRFSVLDAKLETIPTTPDNSEGN
jgi:hypothetical protein